MLTLDYGGSMTEERRSNLGFQRALGDLLHERSDDPLGRYTLKSFLDNIPGYSYNMLRMMVSGERSLKRDVIEAIARELDVPPSYFRAWRIMRLTEEIEKDPELENQLYDAMKAYLDEP